ncbi:hypothetical protein Hdeb2414_s0064g00765691 [Helianthus debilis subsp. tardiflorus]
MEVNAQYKSMNESHRMFTEVVGNLHTSTSNENEMLKKEVEALRADKEIKDEQLNMLYTVIENKLGINVQAVYDEIENQRVEARRIEREKRLAEEAAEALKDKKKRLVIDTEEILGSTSQPDPSQVDEENVSNAESSNVIDVEMKEAEVEVEANVEVSLDIIPIGEAKDVVHSEWASLRQIEVERHRLKAKMNKFKVIDDDKELEMFGDEDEDEDDDDKDEKDDKDYKDDKNDDDDQGATGLLVTKSSGPRTIEDFLNDELNEKHDEDQHHEESSSGTKHADIQRVFLNLPKVIYLNQAEEEGELVKNWTRESMLEALDMDDDKFKFDIEEVIPPTPDREYSFKFLNEQDNFNDVIIEEGSESDDDTLFHYSGLDDDIPTFNELFRSHNEKEVRRKVVEKIVSEGFPETVLKEDLLEERKRWFKIMPEERKYKRPLQLFTRHPDKSPGDILSWGYLEDLKVYKIRREFRVHYFEFISDIKTLPWWDVEELVQTKNIKQCYYGPEVKCHEHKLWDYIKLQAKSNFPDWKPHKLK